MGCGDKPAGSGGACDAQSPENPAKTPRTSGRIFTTPSGAMPAQLGKTTRKSCGRAGKFREVLLGDRRRPIAGFSIAEAGTRAGRWPTIVS
jgi:hypothetical protein